MQSILHSAPIGDSAIPLAHLWRHLDPHTARSAGVWAYHGPAYSPYLTDDDAERAAADTVWATLRDNNN